MAHSLKNTLDRLTTRRITIGVTGFARSGKTVFIGALAQALLTADAWSTRRGQGPLAGFGPFERGQLRSAQIRDDINPTLPQFPFRQVRDALVSRSAHWPEPTEGISRLILELDALPEGGWRRWLTQKQLSTSRLQIELVDYPGEWLVDLGMLEQDYQQWSEQMLAQMQTPLRQPLASRYRQLIAQLPDAEQVDEDQVANLADAWAEYLGKAAAKNLTLNQPGRMLRPDNLKHSPVLRFAPLPPSVGSKALFDHMRARFEQYKSQVIKPFYQNHFARIDRQVVLVDTLRAVQGGEAVFNEMTQSLEQTLHSFNYSKGSRLARLMGARTSKVLFAATKADHVTRGDRANLENMLRWMLAIIDDHNRVRASASDVAVMALASIKATEDYMTDQPPRREILHGRPAGEDQADQWDPGGLPLDMPPDWQAVHFAFLNFQPPTMQDAPLKGFPAINLGRGLDFLISADLK